MTNLDYADSLEQLAAFYRSHPDMALPHPTAHVFLNDKDEFVAAVRQLADGGTVTKESDPADCSYPYYHAKRQFGAITLDVMVPRATVCKLVRPAEWECPESLLEEFAEAQ